MEQWSSLAIPFEGLGRIDIGSCNRMIVARHKELPSAAQLSLDPKRRNKIPFLEKGNSLDHLDYLSLPTGQQYRAWAKAINPDTRPDRTVQMLNDLNRFYMPHMYRDIMNNYGRPLYLVGRFAQVAVAELSMVENGRPRRGLLKSLQSAGLLCEDEDVAAEEFMKAIKPRAAAYVDRVLCHFVKGPEFCEIGLSENFQSCADPLSCVLGEMGAFPHSVVESVMDLGQLNPCALGDDIQFYAGEDDLLRLESYDVPEQYKALKYD